MNVEIGTEAALFPEKEHIKGIFVAEWGGGTLTRLRVRVWGSPNSDDLRKILALCLFRGHLQSNSRIRKVKTITLLRSRCTWLHHPFLVS
jgi:hypothetical protein